MLTVWKYNIEQVGDPFLLELPKGARPLSVQVQEGVPRMWALVDPSQSHVQRQFQVTGAGLVVPDGATYIGTFQTVQGRFVWHLFEIQNK